MTRPETIRGLTLDTGALIALDRGERFAWLVLRKATKRKIVPRVPAPVVVEAWRSPRQAQLARALKLSRVEPLDERAARRAGELCGRAGTDDPVDAVVVEFAARRNHEILTSDVEDLRLLAAHADGECVVRPVSPRRRAPRRR